MQYLQTCTDFQPIKNLLDITRNYEEYCLRGRATFEAVAVSAWHLTNGHTHRMATAATPHGLRPEFQAKLGIAT